MKHLNIVTPCSRPENLSRIKHELEKYTEKHFIKWLIVFDYDKRSPEFNPTSIDACWWDRSPNSLGLFGNPQRNEAISAIVRDDSWVWFLDDDNLPHPDFFNTLHESIIANPSAQGFLFSQLHKNNSLRLRAKSEELHFGIDTAQFVFRRGFIGDHRWEPNYYDADTRFFKAVTKDRLESIVFCDKPVTYWNFLR